jgi:hypothetical protein
LHLLTAALAAQGTAAIIGESKGGWFWLPPWSLWQPWARQGLEKRRKKDGVEGLLLEVFFERPIAKFLLSLRHLLTE